MLRSKTMVWALAAAGAWLLTAAPASAISHEDIAKGAMDGAKGAAEKTADDAKADAKADAKDEANKATGGMMGQVDSAQKAVDSGQKTLKAGQDTLDAAKTLGGATN